MVDMNKIMEEEMEKYKLKIMQAISKHFSNPYCAKTDIGKVMYEKEIWDVIDSVKIK
ncbi:hypothetical protein [Butyribacter intestini]|uniref:hypothetical protein n=1 Tax=Butyribacter intestini TaxID=1703332 RepID=UPI0022E33EB4|nr:hypothetical protein [Butyribacter intestini]